MGAPHRPTFGDVRNERGQATVEWVGIVLLVTLSLAALARLAPSADGDALATTLARSVTHPPSAAHAARLSRSPQRSTALPRAGRGFTARAPGPRSARGFIRRLRFAPPPNHARPALRIPSLRPLLDRAGRAGRMIRGRLRGAPG